jgi:hypothetical protein
VFEIIACIAQGFITLDRQRVSEAIAKVQTCRMATASTESFDTQRGQCAPGSVE